MSTGSMRQPRDLGKFILVTALLFVGAAPADDATPGFRFTDVRTMNGPCCTDEGTDLAVDADGSVLIAGFRGSIDVDNDGRIDIPTFGRPDVLVSKVRLVDNQNLGWTRGPGGPKADRGRGVAPDQHGGVYVVGGFEEYLQMRDDARLESRGGSDGFLARYGSDSVHRWGRAIGGAGQDQFADVAADGGGNAIVVGTVVGAIDVDGDGRPEADAGADGQALIASYSLDGELRWMRTSAGTASAQGTAVVAGPGGGLYVAGWYRNGAPDLDGNGQPDLPESPQTTAQVIARKDPVLYEYNGFYARLRNDGTLLWIRGITGPALQVVASLAVATNGDLLVLGSYSAPPDLDGDGRDDMEFRSMANRIWKYHGNTNTLLMRVTPDGERVWTRRFTAWATHVATKGERIVVSGTYSNDLDFDDDGVIDRASDGDDFEEGFAAVLSDRGELLQLLTVVGDHRDVVTAAGFAPDGARLYLTGHTSLGADFDGDGKIEAASVCHKAGEVFLAVFELDEVR